MRGGIPELDDVLAARRVIAPHLDVTPLRSYPLLDELTGATVRVKHENHNPTGAFKVRGGINLVSGLDAETRARGVYAASTGNHGQSVAYAAQLFGVAATIYVPVGANPVKIAAMRGMGAEVVEFGADFDEARVQCAEVAAERAGRYVHSGNEPLLIAGVGTATFEMLETDPALDVIVVPVGGGSGAAAAGLVAKAIQPQIEVIAVQSEAARAAHDAWHSGELVTAAEMTTFAEGLQTRVPFELPQQIMRIHLDDFVLVSDDAIRAATLHLIELTRTLVEPAGAAGLAAVLALRNRLAGRRVGIICSGANISPAQLRELLAWSAEI